jgi:hypothetical protein
MAMESPWKRVAILDNARLFPGDATIISWSQKPCANKE